MHYEYNGLQNVINKIQLPFSWCGFLYTFSSIPYAKTPLIYLQYFSETIFNPWGASYVYMSKKCRAKLRISRERCMPSILQSTDVRNCKIHKFARTAQSVQEVSNFGCELAAGENLEEATWSCKLDGLLEEFILERNVITMTIYEQNETNEMLTLAPLTRIKIMKFGVTATR